MNPFLSLSRCPICRERASTARGCCEICRVGLFEVEATADSVSLGVYTGRLERAVRAFKFHHATRLGSLFARELAEIVKAQRWQPDVVCAVPLHLTRYFKRGYNQSAVIGKPLARHLGVPYQPLLKRTRATQQQARLAREARFDNVSGAFQARPIPDKRVLLVDDVITSGATTAACVEALQEAGARSVKVAAVARGRAIESREFQRKGEREKRKEEI